MIKEGCMLPGCPEFSRSVWFLPPPTCSPSRGLTFRVGIILSSPEMSQALQSSRIFEPHPLKIGECLPCGQGDRQRHPAATDIPEGCSCVRTVVLRACSGVQVLNKHRYGRSDSITRFSLFSDPKCNYENPTLIKKGQAYWFSPSPCVTSQKSSLKCGCLPFLLSQSPAGVGPAAWGTW